MADPAAPPSRWHAVRSLLAPLWAVGLGVFAIALAGHFRVPLLVDIGSDFALSSSDIALITTFFGLGRLCSDLPAGYVNDRAPARWLFAGAAVLMGAGGLLFAYAEHAVAVYVAAFAMGTSSAVSNTTGMAVFSTATDQARRGTAMALFSAAMLTGQAVGPALSGWVAGWTGQWRSAMLASVLVAVVVLAASIRTPKSARARAPQRRETGGAADSTSGQSLLGRPQRWALYGIPFVSMYTLSSVPQTLVPIVGATTLGLSTGFIGTVLGVAGLGRILGSLLGGYVADHVSRKWALVPSLAIQAAGVALLGVAGLEPWMLSIFLIALASVSPAVAATMLADASAGSGAGRRFGTWRFVGDTGIIVGPAITGLLFELGGAPVAVAPLVVLLVAASLVVGVGIPETMRARAA